MQIINSTASRSFTGNIILLFFSTTWNGFLIFFITSLRLTKTRYPLLEVFYIVFLIPFFLIGFFLIYITTMAFIQDTVFFFLSKRPKLTVDLDIIKPGNEIKVTYFQTFKKDLTLESFNLYLSSSQHIKQNGAITSRNKKDFKKFEELNIPCSKDQEIIKQYNIKIPSKEELGEFTNDLEVKITYKTSASGITFSESFKIKVEI